jgi:hypothetical protein
LVLPVDVSSGSDLTGAGSSGWSMLLDGWFGLSSVIRLLFDFELF